jgi:isoleucyl-tRNA synthetase
MDYKATLNLPRTEFPMKASLPRREPETLRRWEAMDLYGRIRRQSQGAGPALSCMTAPLTPTGTFIWATR